MKRSLFCSRGFSLVELTLAIGVAGFCLIALLGLLPAGLKTNQSSFQQTGANNLASQIVSDLRASSRLPPGQVSKQFSLHGHWAAVRTPDTVYFTSTGEYLTNTNNQTTAPANAVFRGDVTYRLPPNDTTSLADITVTWPAAALNGVQNVTAGDLAKAQGFVEIFAAINR